MNEHFQWVPQPEAQVVLDGLIDALTARSGFVSEFQDRLRSECGSRLLDWIDHLVVPDERIADLLEVGFQSEAYGGYEHPGAVFPRVFSAESAGCVSEWGLALKVDSCVDFARAHGLHSEIQGAPFSAVRVIEVERTNKVCVSAIERHGGRGICPKVEEAGGVDYLREHERLLCRERHHATAEGGFGALNQMLDRVIDKLGRAMAAEGFFRSERSYWMGRNRAARVQKERQDRLGLGWANHDHHTYRSSRENFARLVAVFEKLGLECRERFHAGAEAGWGAQVMESKEAGIVVFADVDMSAAEVLGDFSHEGLVSNNELGTVGLWCALHGDSLFEAGMHHLECQFDFEALALGLKQEAGIDVMAPFSDLPHLKQQFTKGEWWEVEPTKIEKLLEDGKITSEQAEVFRSKGALGSHLENLERRDGYKGFNQQGINSIIAATDPRQQ